MAGITLAQAQAQLDAWLTASLAVATGQSYEIDTGTGRRKLTRADAAEVREMVKHWQSMVQQLTPSTFRRTRFVVPE